MRLNQTAYTTLRRAALDFGKAGTSNLLFSFGVNVTTAEAFHADAFDAFRTNASASETVCAPRCPPAGPLVQTEAAPWSSVLRAPEDGGAGGGEATTVEIQPGREEKLPPFDPLWATEFSTPCCP